MANLVSRWSVRSQGASACTAGVRLAICVALWGSIATRAQAQQAQSHPEVASWMGSFGIDPFNLDLRTRDPGVQGQLFATLGHEWARRASSLGLRAQLTVGADLPRGLRFGDDQCGKCEVGYRRSFGALAGLVTYGWRGSRAIRPYVVGGPSLQVARNGFTVKGVLRQSDVAEVPLPMATTRWSAGVTTGMGVAIQMGRSTLFVEQWLQLPEVLSNMSMARDRVVRPLSIGIRF